METPTISKKRKRPRKIGERRPKKAVIVNPNEERSWVRNTKEARRRGVVGKRRPKKTVNVRPNEERSWVRNTKEARSWVRNKKEAPHEEYEAMDSIAKQNVCDHCGRAFYALGVHKKYCNYKKQCTNCKQTKAPTEFYKDFVPG